MSQRTARSKATPASSLRPYVERNHQTPVGIGTRSRAAIQAAPTGELGQHRTIVSAAFAQSFAPSVQL